MIVNNSIQNFYMPHSLRQALVHGYQQLQHTSKTPHLDTEALLAYTLKQSKEFLFSHPEYQLSSDERKKYKRSLEERKRHRPIAYITNRKDFFGLSFFVDERVLIPRPETETMAENILAALDALLHLPSNIQPSSDQSSSRTRKNSIPPVLLLDVGVGSGCIPIAVMNMLKNEDRKKISCVGIDNDQSSLKVAKKNIRSFQFIDAIHLVHGDLLSPMLKNPSKRLKRYLPASHLFISANLPYLPQALYKECHDDVLKFEPKQALLGGHDGLFFYRQLLNQILQFLKEYPPHTFHAFFEVEPSCVKAMALLIKKLFPTFSLSIKKDLSQQERFVCLSYP